MSEFSTTLTEYNTRGHNTYLRGDYNVDLLKMNRLQYSETYFDSILSSNESESHFCSSFKKKNLMDLHVLARNIHATDPYENYEVLEETLKGVHNDSFPERIVRLMLRSTKKLHG